MSDDMLKSLNKIKISVDENEQMLLKSQTAVKHIDEVIIEKLKEECERLNKEIVEAAAEANEIESQNKTVELNNKVLNETLVLTERSLINQLAHKKCIEEKIKKRKEEADKLIDEYAQYIKTCKEKFELTNPSYKTLRTKRIELEQRKVHCKNVQQEIMELRNVNKQKVEIKRQLFYNDITKFAQNWVNNKEYLEAMDSLKGTEERECVKKLAEVTEMLKQKQSEFFLRNQTSTFNIPTIQFSMEVEGIGKENNAVKAASPPSNNFVDIECMLKNDETLNITSKISNHQNLKYNTNNSKVRILENTTLRQAQDIAKTSSLKAKEERDKEIMGKIQKIAQKFNKNISRQNSKKSISCQNSKKDTTLSQTYSTIDKTGNRVKKLSQQSNVNREYKMKEMSHDAQKKHSQRLNVSREYKMKEMNQDAQKDYGKSGATQSIQNLNLSATVNSGGCRSQLPKEQLSYFNTESGVSKNGPFVQKEFSNSFPQSSNFLSQASVNTNKIIGSTEIAAINANENSQFCSELNNKIQNGNPDEKSTFVFSASEFDPDHGPMGNANYGTLLTSYTDDGEVYTSPKFSPSYCSPPTAENDETGDRNLFSFGQFNQSSLFNFKFN